MSRTQTRFVADLKRAAAEIPHVIISQGLGVPITTMRNWIYDVAVPKHYTAEALSSKLTTIIEIHEQRKQTG